MKAFSVLVFLAACGYTQTEPERIVWEAYQANALAPPQVQFLDGTECPYRPGMMAIVRPCATEGPFCHSGKECDAGLTYADLNVSYVVKSSSVHEGALAHEMYHTYLYLTTGNGDAGHTNPGWNTAVPAANESLTSKGF